MQCPNCGSRNINQYRMVTGPIWCNECGFTAEHKERLNPFDPDIGITFSYPSKDSKSPDKLYDADIRFGCSHPKLSPPMFNSDRCKGRDSKWVREHFPRKVETCPDCGSTVILYASEEHYIKGDW